MGIRASSIFLAVLLLSIVAQPQPKSAPKSINKEVSFPSPIEWTVDDHVDISLTGLIFGPADSPDLMSKAREPLLNSKPENLPERPYVIGLGFTAKITGRTGLPTLDMRTFSRLVRVTDVDGNTETPFALTYAGMVKEIYDLHFKGSDSTQYWDVFPVTPNEKEFLFEVYSSAHSLVISFRIVRKDDDLVIINSTPDSGSACPDFEKNFVGSIGADIPIQLQLTNRGATLSGSEQYTQVGKTLSIIGKVDSLGYFRMQEESHKNHATGILNGRFDPGCTTMSGHYSKPDGSLLQPFKFHELHLSGVKEKLSPIPTNPN
jgi:hypothetical protein